MRLPSLRARIFIALFSLVLMASLLIAGVTIVQYSEQSNTYHEQRLERKENQLKKRLKYLLESTSLDVEEANITAVFQPHLKEIADVLNINFRLYSLSGALLCSPTSIDVTSSHTLSPYILERLQPNTGERLIDVSTTGDGVRTRSSFSYLYDLSAQPLAIVNVPYLDDDSLSSMELKAFLIRLVQVYVVMLIIAIILALFVSSYITRSLETISIKLNQTKLSKTNAKIELTNPSREISALVSAYNHMVDELEASAVKLAKSQREVAWREMAKQVAHEIKNPLTPMRLSIQHFEQQVAKGDAKWNEKVHEFSQSLIQQIDTMSAIASTFSQFATMPTGQSERINVKEVVGRALELYADAPISFKAAVDAYAYFDATQLVRIVNNLINNAIQACEEVEQPQIRVTITKDKKSILLVVVDNGKGIPKNLQDRIFEPTFTTKTSGMGLGLSMVKSIIETYDGSVNFDSSAVASTRFELRIPSVD